MEKSVAYVATAILLGVAAMLPVIVLTPKRADQGGYTLASPRKADIESLQKLGGLEKATVPSGPFQIGLILVFSFVFALGVAVYSKRKIL